jgi:purine catabolism regulator
LIDNDVARRSLVDAYLGPLDRDRAARHLRETLRAYFASDCNAVSTAEALGVDRHTVQRRLRRVEQAVGRSVDECRVEMDVALRVELLDPRAG